jgi:hypothetical protein
MAAATAVMVIELFGITNRFVVNNRANAYPAFQFTENWVLSPAAVGFQSRTGQA